MSMLKRILIASAVFPPEPVTSAYLNYDLAKELSKRYDVTVLRAFPSRPYGSHYDKQDLGSNEGFVCETLPSYVYPKSELFGRFRESVSYGMHVSSYIEKHHGKFDFIYNDGWQLFSCFIIARIAKKYGIPYIVPIQDIYPECLFTNKKYPSLLKKFINTILFPIDKYYQKNAVFVRTISEEMRNYLSETRRIDKSRYLVVNNWQNDEDYLKIYPKRPDDGKLVFAYVGSINAHANVDLMIRAFVEANIKNAEFRIYGGGNKKDYCVDLVKQFGANNIVFDMVSRDQVAFVQSQADVLALALPKGNGNLCLPSKLTSYLLSGRPVLASVDQDSSTKLILEGERCGKTVVPDNEEALIKGFQYFAELPKEELAKMGIKSREYAIEHLTRKVNLSLVIESIKEVL